MHAYLQSHGITSDELEVARLPRPERLHGRLLQRESQLSAAHAHAAGGDGSSFTQQPNRPAAGLILRGTERGAARHGTNGNGLAVSG